MTSLRGLFLVLALGGLAGALGAGVLLRPSAEAAEPEAAGWRSLFDGKALGGWKSTTFGGEGEVSVVDAALRIARGADLSGVTWAEQFPKQNFELTLDARRVEGNDFFCGLTFPVGEDCCSLILGGWGGSVVGLSCIDGEDAANNATTQVREFEANRWYAIRVVVTPARIECHLDGKRIVEQPLEGRRISVRDEVIPSMPLGIATYATTAEIRNIRWRPVPAADAAR